MKILKVCRYFFLFMILIFFDSSLVKGNEIPGQWGTTDTSHPDQISWPSHWVGEKNLRGQWFKILAESPEDWEKAGYLNHAKGEPPDNTYYLWRYDEPLPEGTKILIEGDFPYARMMSFQVTAPWNNQALVSSDGAGLPEIHLLDEDIVPDPGHTNPFLPGADRKAQQRHFHITFELRDGDPVLLNGPAAVPPYRAPGNLRIGGTATVRPGSLFGQPKKRGPAVYVRIYLPDHYDAFAGVEPPVIRIQRPGQDPELAPISRGMPINLTRFIDGYSLLDNPVLTNGLSLKEMEAHTALQTYARRGISEGGMPGIYVPAVHKVFTTKAGELRLFKSFQTAYLKTYLKDYIADPQGCRTALKQRYRYAYGQMGPDSAPPGNDEHTSNHHIYNTYLTGAANLGPGQFLVFHAKAPQTPRTLNGNDIMGSSAQLRYWNMTLQTGTPTKLTPVINVTDEQVTVDKNGYYTIVIGRKEDRPANLNKKMTWRDWPVSSVLSVSMRFLSTQVPVWEHAPQLVSWEEGDYCSFDKNPQAVKARMGEYFPVGRYLNRDQLAALLANQPWETVVQQSSSIDSRNNQQHPNGQTYDKTMMIDGLLRTYRVFVPSTFNSQSQRFPLVIVLHGGQMTGSQMESMTGMSDLAEKEKFIVVYPTAIGKFKGKLYWNDGRVPEVDDVSFISQLIDTLSKDFRIDPRRVYATGYSNGASMTNRLGMELSDKIAAIAPVAGTVGVRVEKKWISSLPMATLYFHGTADPFAYYTGGSAGTYRGSALSADDFIKKSASRNGCQKGPQEENLPDRDGDGQRVTRIEYSDCENNANVEFYRIEEGGHTWPGRVRAQSEKIFGRTTSDIQANEAMWSFFQKHVLK